VSDIPPDYRAEDPSQAVMTPALLSVLQERQRQLAKWGVQNHGSGMWAMILGEEVGEWNQACLESIFGGKNSLKVREEAVQVAAVALQIVECLDRIGWKPGLPFPTDLAGAFPAGGPCSLPDFLGRTSAVSAPASAGVEVFGLLRTAEACTPKPGDKMSVTALGPWASRISREPWYLRVWNRLFHRRSRESHQLHEQVCEIADPRT